MNSRFLLALLSVTALVPGAAMAQPERDGRGPRMRERIERLPAGERPQGRAEFRTDVRVEAPVARPDRPAEAPRAERRDPPRDAQGQIDRTALRRQFQDRQFPDQQREDRQREDWQFPNRQREDRQVWDRGWQRAPQPAAPDREWQRPSEPAIRDRFERRDPPRDAQGQIDRDALRRDGLRVDGRGALDPERREQWRRDDQRRDQWSRDGWSRGDRDWDGNRADRDRWDRDRRGYDGQWNRDWRRDGRYDWNRYRERNRSVYRLPRYYAPPGYAYGYRRLGIGVRLNSFLFGSNYWINDPFYYRLPEVWGPYRWVRYYNDALLVDIYTGQVVDVEYDIFW